MINIIQDNLKEIQHLMKSYGIERAYAFGSVVRGNMKEDSDIDFLIRFRTDIDIETYGNNYFELLYALQQLLKKDVDLVAEETITNPYLLQSINNDKFRVL